MVQTEHSGGLERGLGKRMVDRTAVPGREGPTRSEQVPPHPAVNGQGLPRDAPDPELEIKATCRLGPCSLNARERAGEGLPYVQGQRFHLQRGRPTPAPPVSPPPQG